MHLDAHKPEAMTYRVIDRDTGQMIPHVIWADDSTGEYEVIAYGPDGRPLSTAAGTHLLTIRSQGRIAFERIPQEPSCSS